MVPRRRSERGFSWKNLILSRKTPYFWVLKSARNPQTITQNRHQSEEFTPGSDSGRPKWVEYPVFGSKMLFFSMISAHVMVCNSSVTVDPPIWAVLDQF